MINSCEDVTTAIASDQVETLSWHGRAAVRLHLLICSHCRRYASQLRAIAAAVRRIYGQTPSRDQTMESSILKSLGGR